MILSRRSFTCGLGVTVASTALPLLGETATNPLGGLPSTRSTFRGVTVSANTYSLPQLPIDDAIRAFSDIGFGMAELHPRHIEPSFGAPGRGRGAPPPTPEQIAAAGAAREKLRDWRMTVPLDFFGDVAKKFKAGGLFLYSYNMNFRDDFTDGELDRSFQMTRALGCNVMTAVGSKALYRRLDPLAQRYKIWVAAHNETNSIPTIADFDDVLKGASPFMGMTLDIGHFVASNSDPVAGLASHHNNIYNLHIKDRKKNEGPDLPFGQGDTPIKQILAMDRDRNYHIPANIEWEVANPSSDDRVKAVRGCFEYCKTTLLQA